MLRAGQTRCCAKVEFYYRDYFSRKVEMNDKLDKILVANTINVTYFAKGEPNMADVPLKLTFCYVWYMPSDFEDITAKTE